MAVARRVADAGRAERQAPRARRGLDGQVEGEGAIILSEDLLCSLALDERHLELLDRTVTLRLERHAATGGRLLHQPRQMPGAAYGFAVEAHDQVPGHQAGPGCGGVGGDVPHQRAADVADSVVKPDTEVGPARDGAHDADLLIHLLFFGTQARRYECPHHQQRGPTQGQKSRL